MLALLEPNVTLPTTYLRYLYGNVFVKLTRYEAQILHPASAGVLGDRAFSVAAEGILVSPLADAKPKKHVKRQMLLGSVVRSLPTRQVSGIGSPDVNHVSITNQSIK